MHEAAPRVDVIVPVFGGWEYVADCLAALRAQTYDTNVIVVDDCSPDDTPDRIARSFPEFTLLHNDVNRGFAATCNKGISHGNGDIVVLLNSDVIAEKTLVSTIADAFASAGPAVGSLCPLLLRPDDRVDSFGITADASGAGFVRFHGAPLECSDPSAPPLLGPYGAAAVYRRRALDEVGLLDEALFMYSEELDLALRLRVAGWDTAALDQPGGIHLGGASIGENSPRQRYYSGFGRGYLLRAWRVLHGGRALHAIAAEVIVCVRHLVVHRSVKPVTGRIAGWRAAKGVSRPTFPRIGVDDSIGLLRSLRMRSPRR